MRDGLKSAKISVTTNAGGAGTGVTENSVFGWLYAITIIDGNFDDGVDWTFSVEAPNDAGLARNIKVVSNSNDDKTFYPRTLEHLDTDGAVLTTHCHPVIDGVVKLTIAQGGNTKTGGAVIYYFQ